MGTPDLKPARLRVSLHDVAPSHLKRLRRAEALFTKLRVPVVQYLFVPDFHGADRASESAAFIAWCHEPRSFRVEWLLHGYYHLEGMATEGQRALTVGERVKAGLLTGGEGEFLPLDADEQRRRIRAGLEEFSRCFPGMHPEGFIAPAWLFRRETLLPVLREFNLSYTEDHRGIYDAAAGTFERSPVITWATRTLLRRYGSLIVCPLLAKWFSRRPSLRLAVHPHDFEYPATVSNIETVLGYLLDKGFKVP